MARELELALPTLIEPGGAEWFLEVQRMRLTVRTMMSIRTAVVADWAVPLAYAAGVFRALTVTADVANNAALEATLDSAAGGANVLHAYTAAVAAQERGLRERAAGWTRSSLLDDLPGR